MARKVIDVGVVGNDGTGDSIRDSFRKVNDNFRELYGALGLNSRLSFLTLSDAPGNGNLENYQGQENAVVAVGTDSLIFKQIVAGTGIALDFGNENEIVVTNTRSTVSADDNPQLGGNLQARSGSGQFRIQSLVTPISSDEAANKEYADSKISLAGVNARDPAAGGAINTAFGTMTGPLILSRDPRPEDDVTYGGLIAATKRYVDNAGFGSVANLYVATSGNDARVGVGSNLQGRALSYAYRSLEAALKKAEEIIKGSRQEIGPYKKVLTWTNPINGAVNNCTLTSIEESPDSGTGFQGRVVLTLDSIELVFGGYNYSAGEILKLNIDGGDDVNAATIEILTVNSEPGSPLGPISTFRLLTGGSFDGSLPSNPHPTLGGIMLTSTNGTQATFNVSYKVSNAIIEDGGSDYSLVSVRVSGGGGTGAFGFADVSAGVITSVTITDGGSGFTDFPTLIVNLPRFLIYTAGQNTDFTGDVSTDSAEARRGRDIREGLFLYGESSGALAQILSHNGSLDLDGNELFDIDIKYGVFEPGEEISYGDVANTRQVCVFVEAGIYEENLPLKIPQNVAIIGDEFRRTIIRPKPGFSTSPWAFQYFRRDKVVDGLNTARNEYNAAIDDTYGYHYLSRADEPVYPPVNNRGFFRAASQLLTLNKEFIQEEIIAWTNKQISDATTPFAEDFTYNEDLCKRDVGLIVDAIAYDMLYGGSARTVSAALKYRQNASGLIAIIDQNAETSASIERINTVAQSVIKNIAVPQSSYLDKITGTLIEYSEPQIIDTAYSAESGSGGSRVSVSLVSLSVVCRITTSSAHGLASGDIVTFDGLLDSDGANYTDLNNQSFWVTVINSTTFDIYSDQGREASSSGVNSTGFATYQSNSGDVVSNGGVLGALINVMLDIINDSDAVNYPLDNDKMDVFLCNDAVIGRALTIQGNGGFACVLDPEGQILAKSPYFQEGAVFSKSTGRQSFAGGMYIDGFAGNLRFKITEVVSPTRIKVEGLSRFPQLPASYIVEDSVYRINYVRDYIYSTTGSTATFVLDETTPWPYPVFEYDVEICDRDVGLILNGVAHDIAFNTNYWSRKSGLSYRQANAHVVIDDQLTLTTNAIGRAHDLASTVVTELGLLTSTSESIVAQSKQTINNIIKRGTTAAPSLSLTNPPGLSTALANAKALLLNNMEFLKDEVIAYINDTYSPYDRSTCYRDVGLILEAVLNDVVFGSNYASTTAGLAYYRNLASSAYVLSDQKAATIAGIEKARDLANALITDSGIQTLITAKFAIVTTIINSGTGSAPSLTYTTPSAMTGSLLNYQYAKDQLRLNRTFIQEEIYRWIEAQMAASSSPFSPSYTYDSTKCKRDVGYLVDAFCYDLMYGGNAATVAAANTYFNGTTVISGQVEGTVAAYGRLKTVIQQIVQETSVTRSSGNVLTQDTTGTPSTLAVATELGTLVDNTISIINGSLVTTVAHSYSTYGTVSYVAARTTILASKSTIQQGTVDWLEESDTSFYYDEAKCARDVQYMIEALCYDLIYGGNSEMRDAAYKYYSSITAGNPLQIPENTLTETVGAIEHLRDVAKLVVVNTSVTPTTGNTTPQVTDVPNPSDSGTVTLIGNEFNIIIDTLNNGYSYINGISPVTPDVTDYAYDSDRISAYNALVGVGGAKATIQANVANWVDQNANRFEILMPGNRSMLSNDFTQICDMGYGLVTNNGGLAEAVSMFTYYCYTSYFSLGGGQIRSVGGSSSHGVYAIAAEGSDPLEVPTPTDIYYELGQGAVVYNDGSAYDNAIKGFIIYVGDFDYPPRDGSEIEIDHGGEIGMVRYPVVSATTEETFPVVTWDGSAWVSGTKALWRLNLNSDTDGLVAEVPDGTPVTLRVNTELVLTGGIVGVAVRPSTALKLTETYSTKLYRVLEIADFFAPENENTEFTISIGADALITTGSAHGQLPGYRIQLYSTGSMPGGLLSGDTYYILDDGFTDTTFKISYTQSGTPITTTSEGSGTLYYTPTKLAAVALKDGYDYAELTLQARQPFVTYGASLIKGAFEVVSGTTYTITTAGTTNWVSLGSANNNVGTTFTATSSGTLSSGTGYAGIGKVTFDHTTDFFTKNSHGFEDGDVIRFETSGTLPSNFFTTRQYFVANKTTNTFQVVTYPGSGTPVTSTDNGSGYHFVEKVIGRAGDSNVAIVEIGPGDAERVVGMKFTFKGTTHTVTQYDNADVTGESYAMLYFTPALESSAIEFASAITLFAGVPARTEGSQGTLTIRISLTRVTSHDLLDIGTGSYADTNYPNEIYGPPVRIATETLLDTTGQVEYAQVVERGEGRCFFVTTDQFGNFSVGPFFRVDQGTGTVTFSASLALSNLSGLGFKRGVPIAEFSTDTSMSDNATDTVPTENAVRSYIDRRLGVTHGGENVEELRTIPTLTGGFMPLSGQLAMKGDLSMGALTPHKITNLADPVDPNDAVNLQSLKIANIQDFAFSSVEAGNVFTFTGEATGSIPAKIGGDLTVPGDNAITTGLDSTLNELNVFIKSDIIDNDNINSNAEIAQSKLNMTIASSSASDPSGTTAQIQAANGLASFNNSQFDVVNGRASLKDNGTPLTKIAQIATDTVLGNSTGSTANVTAVTFATVVDEGGSIKKNQFSSATGFIRRRSDATTHTQDSDYSIVEAVSGYSTYIDTAANGRLVIRDSSGDFGGRDVYVSRYLQLGTNAYGYKQFAGTSSTSSSIGANNLYGYGGVLGLSIADGTSGTDRVSTYRNGSHRFRNYDDSAFASIQVSQIITPSITSGGSTTDMEVIGKLALSSGSTFNADAGTLRSTTLSTGAAGTAGTVTGTWSLGASSVFIADAGTLRSTTLSTNSSTNTGTITGNWSLGSGSKLNANSGTLQSTTLTTGNTATAGVITGQWSLSAGSTLNTGATTLTTGSIAGPSALTPGNFTVGHYYRINSLGTTTQTQWNTIAGTTGQTYVVGSRFTCANIGTGFGNGTATRISTFSGYWNMVTDTDLTWGTGFLDIRTGDLYADTLNTGAEGTAGLITGDWSLSGASNLTLGTGYIDARTGTLYADTLTTGASGTGGVVTGAWTVASSSSFVATSIQSQANSATTTSTNANTANTIVLRDASGNFSAGTITATLSGNASSATTVSATVTGTNATDLVYGNMADNDQFRIRIGGTASNAGWAEIATADDGTEPIYVRQYTGVFTTVARTATLLDGSGNTSFPGTVTATGFSGNASSASKVTSTLTRGSYLTGSNFDGSAATTWDVDATSANTASKVIARDANGDFSARIFTGTATAARYADLAERYEADKEYAEGTVVVFGGEKEITTSNTKGDTRIAGVISKNPAYRMNSEAGDDVTHPYVALAGRVPCKVVGKVTKGDILVCSGVHGVAIVDNNPKVGAMIGKALENYDSDHIGTIEVAVGRA